MRKHRLLSRTCIVVLGALLAFAAAASGGGGGGGPSPSSKKDPAPYYQRGLEQLKAGDYAAAQKELKEVLKIVPDNAQALYLMGRAQEGAQDFKAALRSYKKAARANRKLYEARARAGIVSIALDERKDAEDELADLRKAKDRCGNCPAEEQTQIQSAHDALDAALKGKPAGEKLGALPAGRAEGERAISPRSS